jgi:hypothetical protein
VLDKRTCIAKFKIETSLEPLPKQIMNSILSQIQNLPFDEKLRISQVLAELVREKNSTPVIPEEETPELCAQWIEHFTTNSKGRENNDKLNKRREKVLQILHTQIFEKDDVYGKDWQRIREKWEAKIVTIHAAPIQEVVIRAGRNNHFDCSIFFKDGMILQEFEFKFNAKSIDGCPQFLSLPEKKGLCSQSYTLFYYENYLQEIAKLFEEERPPWDLYVKEVCKTESNHPFFINMYNKEKEEKYKEAKVKKDNAVHESISSFLELAVFDLEAYTKIVKNTENNKIYMLYKNDEFYIDRILPSERIPKSIVGLNKQKNSIILHTEHSGTEHHLLLRWRNHLGILNPAWQIKLQRKA